MKIVIADCNHGFIDPEQEEARQLNVDIECLNCTQDDLVNRCRSADIIIVQRLKIDGYVIDQLPRCKVVTRYGVGLDNIDCKALAARQVGVVNFPGFCTEEVANHTVAAIMFFYRKFDTLFASKHSLSSIWGNPVSGIKAASDTQIGILGVGRIGKQVALRLKSCGFKVQGCDPYVNESYMACYDVDTVDIGELFSTSDLITIHVPLTSETKGLVNKDMLRLMPKGSCLVNTSRGEVVDTEDMLESLDSGQLRSAFIDVCDPEPAAANILQNSSLYVTPHCAFYSFRSLDHLKRNAVIKSVEKYNDLQGSANY